MLKRFDFTYCFNHCNMRSFSLFQNYYAVTITSGLTYAGSIIISIEKIVGKLIIEMIGQILGMIAAK